MLPPAAALAELLGADPPPSVRALPPEAQARLADLVVSARTDQRRSLTAGFDAALHHLPPLLRPLVRGMFRR